MPPDASPLRPISDSERTCFKQEGAVLLRGILSADWVAVVRDGLEETRGAPGAMTSRATGSDGRGELTIDQYASLRNDKLRTFVRFSPAAAIAGRLLGSSASRFVLDQMFYKSAGRILPTPWHQDTPYLRISGNDVARLWVTCDPSPEQATVRVVKGSHLWNVVYRPVTATSEVRETEAGAGFSYGKSEDYDQRLAPLPDIDGNPGAFDVRTWDVEPGDILAFNGNIVHGAGGVEMHPLRRRAFATLWAGDDVRYAKRPGLTIPDLAEFAGVQIADGALLREYPDVYPPAWSEQQLAPAVEYLC
jgi:ectoine hydroxylase-related dioxygenase (phytanoyl-CoA dioxygenase family)